MVTSLAVAVWSCDLVLAVMWAFSSPRTISMVIVVFVIVIVIVIVLICFNPPETKLQPGLRGGLGVLRGGHPVSQR